MGLLGTKQARGYAQELVWEATSVECEKNAVHSFPLQYFEDNSPGLLLLASGKTDTE